MDLFYRWLAHSSGTLLRVTRWILFVLFDVPNIFERTPTVQGATQEESAEENAPFPQNAALERPPNEETTKHLSFREPVESKENEISRVRLPLVDVVSRDILEVSAASEEFLASTSLTSRSRTRPTVIKIPSGVKRQPGKYSNNPSVASFKEFSENNSRVSMLTNDSTKYHIIDETTPQESPVSSGELKQTTSAEAYIFPLDITYISIPPKPSQTSSVETIEFVPTAKLQTESSPDALSTASLIECEILPLPQKSRRSRIPDRPNVSINYWGVLKNFIGQELTKVPLPVNFSEPLSMLQRLTEEFEYAELLDKASECEDLHEQVAYVAAFTISAYSTTDKRLSKPFNPLLGETFEFDRTGDLGWRVISEKVSHHPPMHSLYCEGKTWKCRREFGAITKFTGNSIQLTPMGRSLVEFEAIGSKYTWQKVTTVVRNVMVGKLYVEHHGDMDILGEERAEGIRCHLKFLTETKYVKDSKRKILGEVYSANDEVKWILIGYWDKYVKIAPVQTKITSEKDFDSDDLSYKTIWCRRLPEPESEKYYHFTVFASQLNEPEEGVAPTDSRNRPDQRLMEEGRWNEANAEKKRLEEEQRARRHLREEKVKAAENSGTPFPPYEPAWFKWNDEEKVHVYGGEYWKCKLKQDWSRCPNIF